MRHSFAAVAVVLPEEGTAMHRALTSLSTIVVLLAGASFGPSAATAQGGRDYLFADTLGLPEIRITALGGFEGFEGVPAEVPAGRYVVTLTNRTESATHVVFVRLPEGKTAADYQATIDPQSPGPPPGVAQGSLDWVYGAYMAGGLAAYGFGQRVQVIIDLPPGNYAVTDPWPAVPSTMAVTRGPATPTALAQPPSDAVSAATGSAKAGYAFQVTGHLSAGPQVLEIRNDTAQPQHVTFVHSPDRVSRERAMDIFRQAFLPVAFAGTQSAGTTQWLALDLEPGHYVVVGGVTDPASGQPNAALGLVDVLAVGGNGGTSAP
jgi:hypothetical protein